jgi:hypothetical protein
MKIYFTLLLLAWNSLGAQFAPAAGKPGSTAIHADSSCFVNWAKSCSVNVGYKQINQPDSGLATVGNSTSAIGPAKTNGVVSLGDGGCAILQFDPPIVDGDGYDFAVFENAFNDSFLELAHVELSNDLINWVRIPSISLTQNSTQTETFGTTEPQNIHNLAGKYRMPYGTPFDIHDVIDSIHYNYSFQYVRICDVIGSINPLFGTKDSKGNLINDPWPTLFPSSGFDLDAVGVINQGISTNIIPIQKSKFSYNPISRKLHLIEYIGNNPISLYTASGKLIFSGVPQNSEIQIPTNIADGMYILVGNNLSGKILID